MRAAAIAVAAVSLASLGMWLFDLLAPLDPFVSLLLLVASPFLFAMGTAAKGKKP